MLTNLFPRNKIDSPEQNWKPMRQSFDRRNEIGKQRDKILIDGTKFSSVRIKLTFIDQKLVAQNKIYLQRIQFSSNRSKISSSGVTTVPADKN
jgi:hypothetical protein